MTILDRTITDGWEALSLASYPPNYGNIYTTLIDSVPISRSNFRRGGRLTNVIGHRAGKCIYRRLLNVKSLRDEETKSDMDVRILSLSGSHF